MKKELEIIYKIQKDISVLSSVLTLLDWDQKTYMPEDANRGRAEQTSSILKIIHEKFMSEELYKAVKRLHNPRNLNKLKKKDQIIIKRLYKDVLDARKIPTEFVEELAKTSTIATMAWQKAKEKNDFKIFAPWLKKLVKLKRQESKYIGIKGHIYNSLLDEFEEGMTVEKIKPIFDKLKEELIQLLKEIKKTRTYKIQKNTVRGKKYSITKQKKLSENIINLMTLPPTKSRLDMSSHPFTLGLSYDDIRITTRYDETNPFESLTSTIHEAGHCLYQLGLPREFEYTVIGGPASIGLHESQSKFWENMIGKNIWFWNYYFSTFKKEYREELKNVVLRDFYKDINMVKPGTNRVMADEVTYCLHVILRFELELELIEGKLRIDDLPKAWKKKMKEFLGVVPKNDREGVLQDIHWGLGAFGYFPTYAIGVIYASQLFDCLKKEKPSIKKQIEKGNFKPVVDWLKEHVHKYGRILTADQIIKKTCRKGLDPDFFIQYLRNKYLELYK
ncbi:MAG: carboxypeptidase M32 [Nanoarchaeota archaeon]|nr:carboxypeptidase M32 [Nanoarchaeota archaeon]